MARFGQDKREIHHARLTLPQDVGCLTLGAYKCSTGGGGSNSGGPIPGSFRIRQAPSSCERMNGVR